MFERLVSLLHSKAKSPEPLGEIDAQMALGTLLVRVAMADEAYLFEEIEQIDRILSAAFNMKPLEAARHRAKCEKFSSQLPEDADLAKIVRESVHYDHRLEAVEALWQVAAADGITHSLESDLVRLVEETLGVSRDDSEAAQSAATIS